MYSISIPVQIKKRGKYYEAYTPALELTTQGKTLKEVQARFTEIVDIFIKDIFKRDVAKEVLEDLGWKVIDNKKKITPPVFDRLDAPLNIEVNIPELEYV